MIKIPGGNYKVGTDDNLGHSIDQEGPAINVEIDSFYIDKTTVSNREFAKFVDETHYITEAEKLGSSFVFYLLLDENTQRESVQNLNWWQDVKGANWKYPFGDKRSYLDLLDHPVVHVSRFDALMYAKWASKRLPSEIEWEIAARGGSEDLVFPWGNELFDTIHRANVWQGTFPYENTADDGYIGTSPVYSFYTNDYGVSQMLGNVWEMCSNPARIPLIDIQKESLEKQIANHEKHLEFAARGGSFLCHHNYCNRYRLAARNGIDRLTASSNLSFRCVKDIEN